MHFGALLIHFEHSNYINVDLNRNSTHDRHIRVQILNVLKIVPDHLSHFLLDHYSLPLYQFPECKIAI